MLKNQTNSSKKTHKKKSTIQDTQNDNKKQYQFLLQSLERDHPCNFQAKQNHLFLSQKLNKNTLDYSYNKSSQIFIKPSKVKKMSNSFHVIKSSQAKALKELKDFGEENYNVQNRAENGNRIKIKSTKVDKEPSFFDNVKFLGNSRMALENTLKKSTVKSHHNHRKEARKNKSIELLNSTHKIQSNKSRIQKSKINSSSLSQQKYQKNIEISNSFSNSKSLERNNNNKSSAFGIYEDGNTTQTNLNSKFNDSISLNQNNKQNICCKYDDNSNEYKKVIEQLYSENFKLENLVSQHEKANIKMFIKMNENESVEMEKFKKYLSNLFEKYKALQKLVIQKEGKNKKLKEDNRQLLKVCKQLNKKLSSSQQQCQRLKKSSEQNSKKNSHQNQLLTEEIKKLTALNAKLSKEATKVKGVTSCKNCQGKANNKDDKYTLSEATLSKKLSAIVSKNTQFDQENFNPLNKRKEQNEQFIDEKTQQLLQSLKHENNMLIVEKLSLQKQNQNYMLKQEVLENRLKRLESNKQSKSSKDMEAVYSKKEEDLLRTLMLQAKMLQQKTNLTKLR